MWFECGENSLAQPIILAILYFSAMILGRGRIDLTCLNVKPSIPDGTPLKVALKIILNVAKISANIL
jgi:hypothetical protein